MLRTITLALCLLVSFATLTNAHPRHHYRAQHHHRYHHDWFDKRTYTHGDPRPRAWCGWYLRHLLGVADRSYNLAINWLHYGRPHPGPCVGCIAVGHHHVARIVGYQSGQWVTEDGNYNGRAHVGPRSLRWAIAYRTP